MLTTSPHLPRSPKQPLGLLLFDLDGTLLDSSEGIFNAIKHAFICHKLPVDFKADTLRQHAGRGVEFLLKKINGQLTSEQLSTLKYDAFLHYQLHAADMTHPFIGTRELMDTLHEYSIDWGIVTSKTRKLTAAVIDKVPQYKNAKIIVCADDLTYKKPHPMPIIHALKSLNRTSQHTAYIGDTQSDMIAAKRAYCYRIFADYGYEVSTINEDDYDLKISNLEQLRQWIIYTLV
ncbi:HAD family hydrolase [Cysteiniphilum halobium]|uniref:HAD family hydrolase n=1 Tax=Cysteiniphilum halobium TaxID=2219059 RepID=UPI003F854541